MLSSVVASTENCTLSWLRSSFKSFYFSLQNCWRQWSKLQGFLSLETIVRAVTIEISFWSKNLQQSTITPAFRYYEVPILRCFPYPFSFAHKGPRELFLPPLHFSYVCFHFWQCKKIYTNVMFFDSKRKCEQPSYSRANRETSVQWSMNFEFMF